jgi:hypothetical protein
MHIRPLVVALVLTAALASSAEAAKPKAPAASPAPAAAAAPAAFPENESRASRVINLDPNRTNVVFIVKTTIGFATILKMPELWVSQPVCGDCVFGDAKPTDGAQPLYRLDMDPAARTITIKPIRIPGPQPDGSFIPPEAFVINVGLTLEGGMTVVLTLQLVINAAEADAYLEFKLPDDALGKAKKAKLESDLEAQFADRVKQATDDALLGAFMTGARCRDFSGRPTREDALLVRMKQLCKLHNVLYVVFEAQNRGRTEALLRDATLSSTTGIASDRFRFEKPLLRFNERSAGVASIPLLEGSTLPPTTFTLTVAEDGGKDRTIVVEGIEF